MTIWINVDEYLSFEGSKANLRLYDISRVIMSQ